MEYTHEVYGFKFINSISYQLPKPHLMGQPINQDKLNMQVIHDTMYATMPTKALFYAIAQY